MKFEYCDCGCEGYASYKGYWIWRDPNAKDEERFFLCRGHGWSNAEMLGDYQSYGEAITKALEHYEEMKAGKGAEDSKRLSPSLTAVWLMYGSSSK